MKTYIVNWLNSHNKIDGKYGLIQATSFDNAWDVADSIASPFKLAEFKIPKVDGDRYLEINEPEEPYAGSNIENFDWENSNETGLFK